MEDTFTDVFDSEGFGFNIVFVDDDAFQRKLVINGLNKVVNKKNSEKEPEEQKLKLNFKTAINCGYAIKLVKQLIKDNERIDLILMDNDFNRAQIDCDKKHEFKDDDEYIYEICCDNDKKNNGNNTTRQLRNIGYMGPIYSISSQVDDDEWVNKFIEEYKGTGAVGKEEVGTEAVGKGTVGTEAVGKGAVGTEAVGTEAVGKGKRGRNATLILELIERLIKTSTPIKQKATISPNILDIPLSTISPNILDIPLSTISTQQKAIKKKTGILSGRISMSGLIPNKFQIVPKKGGKKTKKRLKNKNKTKKRLKNGGKKLAVEFHGMSR